MFKIKIRKLSRKLAPIAFIMLSFVGTWGSDALKAIGNCIES